MDASSILDTLKTAVPGASYEAGASVDFATIYVPAASLVETCRALRDTPSLRFNVLIEVTAADYLPREPRFEVVYHLLSIPNRLRLRVKVRVASNEVDGVLPTVQSIWPAAGWPEREIGKDTPRARITPSRFARPRRPMSRSRSRKTSSRRTSREIV
ncbi:MAG: hypothetical protein DMF88_15280 [Acidobacteria bacterium]|nr:MAG: hypothetical protein DMF88_15280 [Acidobacteriota bacterium]